MSFWGAYQIATSVVFSMMTALWLCSLIAKDASLVDRFWGAGFVFIAWALAMTTPELTPDMKLLTIIVSVWGLRLSLYIHFRNRGHGEDYRYVEMRQHHGKNFWWYSFLSVFMLQGVLMLIVAAPVIFVLAAPRGSGLGSLALAGAWVWFVGFVMEAGGDFQLSRFKSNPQNKGQLLKSGLWSITRHPNYFGDALQWWGFGLFALQAGEIVGMATLVGPVVMTLFIIKVSGVALLEKNLKVNKPGYAEYVAATPAFFPKWPFWAVLSLGVVVMSALAGVVNS